MVQHVDTDTYRQAIVRKPVITLGQVPVTLTEKDTRADTETENDPGPILEIAKPNRQIGGEELVPIPETVEEDPDQIPGVIKPIGKDPIPEKENAVDHEAKIENAPTQNMTKAKRKKAEKQTRRKAQKTSKQRNRKNLHRLLKKTRK